LDANKLNIKNYSIRADSRQGLFCNKQEKYANEAARQGKKSKHPPKRVFTLFSAGVVICA